MDKNPLFLRINLKVVGWLCFIGITILLSAYAHMESGFTLPIPWDDESAFLLQAFSFANTGSLFSEALNPERTIMWMPPGYMVITGSFIKLFGFNFAAIRWLSWSFGILGLLGLLYLFRERFLAPLFALFFLGAPLVASCNVARMETLLLCIVVAGFVYLQREKNIKGIALLLLGVLIHPNGVIFLSGGVLWSAFSYVKTRTRPAPSEWVIMLFVVGGMFLYLLHIAKNWPSFVQDMLWQFQFKGMIAKQGWATLLLSSKTLLLLLYCILFTFSIYRRRPVFNSMIGLLCLLVWILRGQMWYELFLSISACILIIEMTHLAWHGTKQYLSPIPCMTFCSLLCASLCFWTYKDGLIPGPKGYPYDLSWGWGMTMAPESKCYISDDEIEQVRKRIQALCNTNETQLVQFYPAADCLFFQPQQTDTFSTIQPVFCNLEPDIIVLHETQFTPSWLQLEQIKSHRNLTNHHIALNSQSSHRWYIRKMNIH